MKRGKWIGLLLVALVFLGLAFTAGRWWPALLDFLGVNKDSIEALDALVSIISVLISGLFAFLGLLGLRTAKNEQSVKIDQRIQGSGNITNAPVINAKTVIVVDDFAHTWRFPSRSIDKQAMIAYLDFLKDRYYFIDPKGFDINDRTLFKLPLLELYVPLKAMREIPEGEIRGGEAQLAGRLTGGIEASGQRMGQSQSMLDLLQQSDGLIVLGHPGAGKTTFLKFLTLILASGQWEMLGVGKRLPMLVSLSAYAQALRERDVRLDDFIVQNLHERGIDLPIRQMLTEALQQGAALILLDGLDEVSQLGLRHTVVQRVVDFYTIHRRSGNKFVITSRIVDYDKVRPPAEGLVECTLANFSDEDINEFIGRWTYVMEGQFHGDSIAARDTSGTLCEELLQAIQKNQNVRYLAANPLLLTILVIMQRQGVALPERRVELYDKYIKVLLSSWPRWRSINDRSTGRELDLNVQKTVNLLAPLAKWMHEVNPGVGLVSRRDLEQKLTELFEINGSVQPDKAASQFLQEVCEASALLLEWGQERYGFVHLTFEEYLAAVAVALQAQGDSRFVIDFISNHIDEQTWYEVSLLVVGYMAIGQNLNETADKVVGALAIERPGQPGKAAVLAGNSLVETWAKGTLLKSREHVVAALVETTRDEVVSTELRFSAGELLGRLDDPRPGVCQLFTSSSFSAGSGVRKIPRLDWVHIPDGPFLMGSPETFRKDFPEECPQHPLEIPGFYISRFLVTYAQYAPFILAGGYRQKRYWTEEGWNWRLGKKQHPDLSFIRDEKTRHEWKEWLALRPPKFRNRPFFWDDPQLSSPNRPVVGISWFEALAYCSWLEEQLLANSAHELALEDLSDEERGFVRRMAAGELRLCLPSEAEWEKAARGPLVSSLGSDMAGEERAYPWGDNRDSQRANTKETKLSQTSPVGVFPGGVGPYGVHDLIGNVWEWTRSRWGSNADTPTFGYPYNPADGRENLDSLDFCILRGGSWYDDQGIARCGCRGGFIPGCYNYFIGFRIAASLAGSES